MLTVPKRHCDKCLEIMTEFPSKDERMNAYLDDLLSPEQRVEFELELERDASLRATMKLQREIDRSLQQMFSPPNDPRPSLPAQSERGARQRNWTGNLRRIGFWAVAASVVWFAVFLGMPRSHRIRFNERPLEEIYDQCVTAGFQPYWDCNDDPDRFAATFRSRNGVALKLGQLLPGCRMAGLSYLAGISRSTTAMLALVDSDEVIVFVDELVNDRDIEPPPESSGLRLYRKELGSLVLYEITPRGRACFLDAFELKLDE